MYQIYILVIKYSMWHTLLHSTNAKRLIEIINSKKLGNELEYIDIEKDDKLYKKELLFTYYLSSKIKNIIGKEWCYKKDIIIGISPEVLNKSKWMMCDRMAGMSCIDKKYKIVIKSYKSKKVDYNKITNYINKRLDGFNNEQILKEYKYYELYRLFTKLDETFINNGIINTPYNNKYIVKKINELENMSDKDIINSKDFKSYLDDYHIDNKFINSHELVFLEPIDIKYIKFIIINTASKRNKHLYEKLKQIIPPGIKVIESYGINKYNERINKKLSIVSDVLKE